MAGCALSFIGWPTIDGSCGSDIILTDPVGIVAQSEHTDGSWTFIKYMIQNTEESDQNGLPVYRPLLETMCEAAKEDSALPVKFRDTDQETCLSCLMQQKILQCMTSKFSLLSWTRAAHSKWRQRCNGNGKSHSVPREFIFSGAAITHTYNQFDTPTDSIKAGCIY